MGDLKKEAHEEMDPHGGQEFKEFRKLLREGIGLRTQREFARVSGISYTHLNRMLNQKVIARPSKNTLKTMAEHMSTVTLKALLVSCGYETEDIQTTAAKLVRDFKEFFLKDGQEYHLVCETIERLCEAFDMLYRPEHADALSFHFEPEIPCNSTIYPQAENSMQIGLTWKNTDYECRNTFTIYYAKTTAGKLLIMGINVKQAPDGTETQIIPKEIAAKTEYDAASRFLKRLFGGEAYETVSIGPGLPYKETPPGFADFLSNHRSAFCTNPERIRLWKRVVADGEDPDQVFCSFADNGGGTGTGAVIATIMTEELKDEPYMEDREFLYMEPCEALPEEERDAFIMTKNAYSLEDCPKEIRIRLYFYAKELGIPKFGLCYYRHATYRDASHWYDTDKYGECLR